MASVPGNDPRSVGRQPTILPLNYTPKCRKSEFRSQQTKDMNPCWTPVTTCVIKMVLYPGVEPDPRTYKIRWLDRSHIEQINTSSLKPKIARPELVVSYKKTIHNLPPIFVSVGRLLTDNTVCRFQDHTIKIMDGNHRAQAHIELGIKTITAILPLSHWRALNDS